MTPRHEAEPEPGQIRGLIDGLRAYCEILREPPLPGGGQAALCTTTLCVWGLVRRPAVARTITEACQPTVRQLRTIAHAVASTLPATLPSEFEPFSPVVYDSRQTPGRDEISVRLAFRSPCSDRELARLLKASIKTIGLGEGQWHRQGEQSTQ